MEGPRQTIPPHCDHCGRIMWEGDDHWCEQSKKGISKKLATMLDINKDGEVTVDDIHALAPSIVRHEGMFIAGVMIMVGSMGNVLEYWSIDSDFFWFCAGVAAVLEYIDDIRKRRRGKDD